MRLFKFLAAILVMSWVGNQAIAQYATKYFFVGVTLGATNYKGDLDDNFTLKFTRPGLGLVGGYKLHPHINLRLTFNQGWMGASDAKAATDVPRTRRNLSFRSPLTEASFQIQYEFFANNRKFKYRPQYTPYLFGGGAIFKYNPQARLGGEWYDLQPIGTEGQYWSGTNPATGNPYPEPYSLVQVSIPFGVGVRFKLTDKIDLSVEMGLRKCFTDYLDDVSGNYPDFNNPTPNSGDPTLVMLLSDRIDRGEYPMGAGGNYVLGTDGQYHDLGVNGIRGDNTQDDWYVISQVMATYILDWEKCPKFRGR